MYLEASPESVKVILEVKIGNPPMTFTLYCPKCGKQSLSLKDNIEWCSECGYINIMK